MRSLNMVKFVHLLLLGVLAVVSVELSAQTAEASVSETEVDNGVVDINKFSGPEQAVWNTTQMLLNIIDEERAGFTENPNKFYDRVAEALEPAVGFRRIAAMVMGSFYKQATKAQKIKFSQLFQRSLVETYSGGLIEYDGYKIDVLPGEPVPEGQRTAVVDVVITTSSGTQVPIKYSMYQTKNGAWKVQNVTVAGINVGLLYRQQFARKVAEAGGDINVVVDQWSSKLDVEVEDGQLKTDDNPLK